MLYLKRTSQSSVCTLGGWWLGLLFVCFTLELPWLGNQHMVSCIPAGTYQMVYTWSDKHQRTLWHIIVPGRDNIEVHIGNFPKDTDGCVLCGTAIDLNDQALTGSHGAFDAFETALQPYEATGIQVEVSDPA